MTITRGIVLIKGESKCEQAYLIAAYLEHFIDSSGQTSFVLD